VTYRRGRIHHGKYERPALGREGTDSLRPTVLEQPRQRSLIDSSEFATVGVVR
jgi:hypothetical protein